MRLVQTNVIPYFQYPSNSVQFQIKFVSDGEVRAMRNRCTEIAFTRHNREDRLNEERFRREFFEAAIVGWRGLRRRDLVYFLDPNVRAACDAGETMDDEIPFSAEMRRTIAENTHADFAVWVMTIGRDSVAFAAAAENEMENLPPTSIG